MPDLYIFLASNSITIAVSLINGSAMALSPGDRIGLYVIQGVLGSGGTASVYRATHDRMNRTVALKVIHIGVDADFRQRFLREAQIVGALDHPNIVPIYDFDDSGDTPFLIMKLIGGPTLKSVLTQGSLSPDRIVEICRQVAAALDYAHDRNVLHRDVKPSNILLDEQGTPYLSDFGLARVTHAPDSTISEGMLLGTPYYIAPEQVLGHGVDRRADNYSLGVVLYEMLTGRVPFSAGTPYTILQNHVHTDLPRPRLVNPNIPDSVEAVLLRALAKDREQRFDRAGELIAAMEEAYRSEHLLAATASSKRGDHSEGLPIPKGEPDVLPLQPHPTRPILVSSSTTQTGSSPSRRPRMPQAVIVGLALCLIAAVFLGVAAMRQRSGAPDPETAQIPMIEVREVSLIEAQLNRREAPEDPLAYLELAQAQFADGLAHRAEATLQEGAAYTDRLLSYWLTAAEISLRSRQYATAIRIFAQILEDAGTTSQYPVVRDQVGQVLYRLAGEASRLSAGEILGVTQELRQEVSPLIASLIARAFIVTENYRLAELTIFRALAQESSLPEAHLILGELRFRQEEFDQAKAEWNLARSAVDAPEWVQQAAQLNLITLPQ
ncbi:MAG: protein kinase [Anaerolineae bacterium]|nr:protein kinase [Anaerolineae bacterium]